MSPFAASFKCDEQSCNLQIAGDRAVKSLNFMKFQTDAWSRTFVGMTLITLTDIDPASYLDVNSQNSKHANQ